jgi:hypothetical protein
MKFHRQQVRDLGAEYIRKHYSNIKGMDVDDLVNDYMDYIDMVHDVPKFSKTPVDVIVNNRPEKVKLVDALSGMYNKNVKNREVFDQLNKIEKGLQERFRSQTGMDKKYFELLREVEELSDKTVRSLTGRVIPKFSFENYRFKISFDEKYSPEFNRNLYPPYENLSNGGKTKKMIETFNEMNFTFTPF